MPKCELISPLVSRNKNEKEGIYTTIMYIHIGIFSIIILHKTRALLTWRATKGLRFGIAFRWALGWDSGIEQVIG